MSINRTNAEENETSKERDETYYILHNCGDCIYVHFIIRT